DGWFYKGVIYNEVAKNDKFSALLNGQDGRMIAFQALQKYIELDPKNLLGTLEQNARLFDIYNGYFDLAANGYNAKNYDQAFLNFKNALTIEEYISGKGYTYGNFSFPKLDTSLIQNIALSAMMAKKEDSAVIYYQKLADAKISGPNFLNIYQFLVQHFQEKGDKANMDKYMALGKELYPTNEYWCSVQLKEAGDDKAKLFAKYDELTSGGCGTYSMYYNYAAELFNYLYTQDKKPADYAEKQGKLTDVLKKTIAVNNTPEANLLAARNVYNQIYDLQDKQDAIKGTKPDDVKKRNEVKGQISAKFEELLPYAQAAYDNYDGRSGNLKPSEKGNFKVATDLLTRYWENKKDAAKMKMYQDKMKSMD
ncbi:MAG TPA: hypothetical protein VG870_03040, partial [Chitinophagaceae bacterium]|nr:hypothetical protein [Chitinophagaceae bacterium]